MCTCMEGEGVYTIKITILIKNVQIITVVFDKWWSLFIIIAQIHTNYALNTNTRRIHCKHLIISASASWFSRLTLCIIDFWIYSDDIFIDYRVNLGDVKVDSRISVSITQETRNLADEFLKNLLIFWNL